MEDISMPHTTIDEVNFEVASITCKIVITCMVVMFFVLSLCFIVSLYARWYLSRYSTYRDSSQVTTTTQARVARKRRGVDRPTLMSLPIIVYDPKECKEELECSVCLSEISQGETIRLLPNCNHGFHLECIDTWFKSHSTCPLCRNSMVSNEKELDSEVDSDSSSDSGSGSGSDSGSDDENYDNEDGTLVVHLGEQLAFPTNVLFWGNQVTNGVASTSSTNFLSNEQIVIEIPSELCGDCLPLPSSTTRGSEEEGKTPVVSRLRSFQRLLSRGSRVASWATGSTSGSAEV